MSFLSPRWPMRGFGWVLSGFVVWFASPFGSWFSFSMWSLGCQFLLCAASRRGFFPSGGSKVHTGATQVGNPGRPAGQSQGAPAPLLAMGTPPSLSGELSGACRRFALFQNLQREAFHGIRPTYWQKWKSSSWRQTELFPARKPGRPRWLGLGSDASGWNFPGCPSNHLENFTFNTDSETYPSRF